MKNSYVRDILIHMYGPKCWLGGIVTKENYLTYHHIKPVREGGRATIENGALLSLRKHAQFNVLEQMYPEFGAEVNYYLATYRGTYPEEIKERIDELMSLVSVKEPKKKHKKKSNYSKTRKKKRR